MTERPWRDPEDEIREEIEHHLDERARELEAEGLTPDQARRTARAAFGDRERIERETLREDRRAARGRARPWEAPLQDVRHVLRGLRRNPGFNAAVLLTLALGIGADAAVYSAAEAIFLQAPPVRDPGSLVAVYTTCRDGRPRCSSSYPDYVSYRDGSRLLVDLAARSSISYAVAAEGSAPRLTTTWLVSGNYFSVLGVRPAAGRLLGPRDHDPSSPTSVAVLSFGTWRDRFGGDPSVVGRTLRVNGVPVEIVGVAPEGFRGLQLTGEPELFLPMATGTLLGAYAVGEPGAFDQRGIRWIETLVGRLPPGAGVDALQDEMAALGAALAETWPDERDGRSVTVESAGRYLLPRFGREDLARMMALLAGVVLLTLTLACANVANLLLARATERRREIGMRLALGAGRWRLLGQAVVEGVVLAMAGAAAGLGVAWLLLEVLGRFTLPGGVSLERLGTGIDGSVVAFSAGMALVTGIGFGLVPGLRGLRTDSAGALRSEITPGRGEARTRKVLVSVQVALCLVLMVGSGLFLLSLARTLRTDLGFRPEGVALARFDLGILGYEAEEAVDLLRRADQRLSGLAGVQAVGWGSRAPLQVGGNLGVLIEIPGLQPPPEEAIRVEYVVAGGGLLDALGIEVVRGREALSAPDGEAVALVDGAMADRYWGSADAAVGERLVFGGQSFAVAGVTGAVHWREVADEATNFVLLPAAVAPSLTVNLPVTLAVRTDGGGSAFLPTLRRELQALEPDLTFHFLRPADDLVAEALTPQRMGSLLFSAFALLALTLSALGVGGIVAYAVARGRREIGVRIALGASRGQVVRSAVLDVMYPVAAGLVAGAALAFVLAGSAATFLSGAEPGEAQVYAMVAGLLSAVAGLAALLPARRAARVDPVEVLRET